MEELRNHVDEVRQDGWSAAGQAARVAAHADVSGQRGKGRAAGIAGGSERGA